ncbi:MAG: FAD-dependent oxidoreductase [Bilophila wadsworthia]
MKASAKTRESTPAPPCWSWKTCPPSGHPRRRVYRAGIRLFYAEFGSRVTILERGSRFLAREDADMADSVRKALENKGVTIITGASASAVRDAGDEAEVRFILDGTEQALPADAILLATGRRPLTAGLNLEAAGVKTTEQGAIAVDERLQTSVPHIWALGDVKGGPQFTYISLDDFRIVRDALYGEGKRVASDRNPAYTVFMDPPLGRVGLTEQAARDKNLDIKVAVLLRQPSPRPVDG